MSGWWANDEDDDMKQAIALSLKESQRANDSGFGAASSSSSSKKRVKAEVDSDVDELDGGDASSTGSDSDIEILSGPPPAKKKNITTASQSIKREQQTSASGSNARSNASKASTSSSKTGGDAASQNAAQAQLKERAEMMRIREMAANGKGASSSSQNTPARRPAQTLSMSPPSPPRAGPSHASAPTAPRNNIASSSSSSSSSTSSAMQYPNGALRITRTPGRGSGSSIRNTITLEDLINKKTLVSACIFSYFIGQHELFQHLPFSKTSNAVPIYIGRDIAHDPCSRIAADDAGLTVKAKFNKTQLEQVKPALRRIYKKDVGINYHAFYPHCSGAAHSKILVLVYPTFLRLVITSANLMAIDTELGDNHWYIHDVPKRKKTLGSLPSGFEAELLSHLTALDAPYDFLDSVRGNDDYTTVKVSLVTSVPGTHAGEGKAEQHGLLRLRKIVKDWKLGLPTRLENSEVTVEVCAASIGGLNNTWLDVFVDCAIGRKYINVDENADTPTDLRIVYPDKGDVERCHGDSKRAASNMGCHTAWDKAPRELQELFHHYRSKDDGRLTHQKLIMVLNTSAGSNSAALPHYVYVGSANLSAAAWGKLEEGGKAAKGNSKECASTFNYKCKISNLECGVVIPGHLLMGLLENGTRSWKDGVITYQTPAVPYDLERGNKPFNDPGWAKGRRAQRDSDDDDSDGDDVLGRRNVIGRTLGGDFGVFHF